MYYMATDVRLVRRPNPRESFAKREFPFSYFAIYIEARQCSVIDTFPDVMPIGEEDLADLTLPGLDVTVLDKEAFEQDLLGINVDRANMHSDPAVCAENYIHVLRVALPTRSPIRSSLRSISALTPLWCRMVSVRSTS